MQFSRSYRTGIPLSIVLAATVAPSAFGVIQIDNYLIDGVPSADMLNDPSQPYAHAYDSLSGGDSRDIEQQETNAALGGWRTLEAWSSPISGNYSPDRQTTSAVIGYGPSNQQGLTMSTMKGSVEGDTYDVASIAYGSDNGFSSLQLNLNLIEFLNGQDLSAGSFQLNLKSFTASGEDSGNIRIGLLLSSHPSGEPIEDQEVERIFTAPNASTITWSFTEFPTSILEETDLIQLILYSGNDGNGYNNVSLVADSFTIVPEPSTYALMLGGAIFLSLIQRKHKSKHT